jgi:VanZ family protein
VNRSRVAAAWLLALVVAALLPTGGAGGAPPVPALAGVGADHLLHAVGYGLLAVAVARAASSERSGVRAAAAGLVAAVVAGAGTELLQAPLPWRSATTGDLAADALGAAVALAGWLAWRRASGRRRATGA